MCSKGFQTKKVITDSIPSLITNKDVHFSKGEKKEPFHTSVIDDIMPFHSIHKRLDHS